MYTMKTTTLSVRMPEEIDDDLAKIMRYEKLSQISEAIRKLLQIGLQQWKQDTALRLLQEGKITFTKAAELAALSVWELSDLIEQTKTQWVNISKEDLHKDIEAA